MSDIPPAEGLPDEASKPVSPPAQVIIAITAMTIAMVIFLLLIFVDMTDAKLAIMAGFGGIAFGWGGAVVNFYFGTSVSSQQKDSNLASTVSRLTGGRG